MQTKWYKNEYFIIAVCWMLIFASDPLYMVYAEIVSDFEFQWEKIFRQWGHTAIFLLLFLVHHFFLVPRFLKHKKIGVYSLSVLVSLAGFIALLLCQAPEFQGANHFPEFVPNHVQFHDTPPPLLTPPDLARLVMAVMMLGLDIAVMAWFNDNKMRQRLLLLEQQNLKQELQHLRYQINPHFFMNTLNNIHALIDIDQERAKRCIVELSGMMRYSLYEGNESFIPLQHEVEFLKQYISLMKLRYSNKLDFQYELPESTPAEVMMSPLLLATFVENAFKHGVSYQNPSFIRLSLKYDKEKNLILFNCENSKHLVQSSTQDGHHGIGLVNVRKRLDLQYPERYTLIIDDADPQKFTVNLTLPAI